MNEVERDYYQDMIISSIKRIDRVDILIFLNKLIQNIMNKEKLNN